MAIIGAPTATSTSSCTTYHISKKVATSYALKPPLTPEAEPKSCPEAPKCDVLKKEENINTNQDDVKKTEENEQPRRRRHHRRYRSYWR